MTKRGLLYNNQQKYSRKTIKKKKCITFMVHDWNKCIKCIGHNISINVKIF